MIKELEELVKELNNGKLRGATYSIAKLLKISDTAVGNWFRGRTKPTEDNIEKMAKKTKKAPEEVKKIFDLNYQSNNIDSFNNTSTEEIKNYKERIKLLEEKIAFLEEKINFYKNRK